MKHEFKTQEEVLEKMKSSWNHCINCKDTTEARAILDEISNHGVDIYKIFHNTTYVSVYFDNAQYSQAYISGDDIELCTPEEFLALPKNKESVSCENLLEKAVDFVEEIKNTVQRNAPAVIKDASKKLDKATELWKSYHTACRNLTERAYKYKTKKLKDLIEKIDKLGEK